MATTEIAFSKEQQSALLGHCLADERIFNMAVDAGVKDSWWNHNALHAKLWIALTNFRATFKRYPSQPEFEQFSGEGEESQMRSALTRTISECVVARDQLAADVLINKLREWARAIVTQTFLQGPFSRLWNKGQAAEATRTLLDELVPALSKIDSVGVAARLAPSIERMKGERAARIGRVGKNLTFGVTYLDDALRGIWPNDLIVLGGPTGQGKTQILTQISKHNTAQGKKVVFFALEAEPFEIERRIKFGILNRLYHAAHPDPDTREQITFDGFLFGDAEAAFAEFEEAAEAEFRRDFATLETLYRHTGDYGAKELERDILRVAGYADLVIIDHLHYIDIDSGNENAGVKDIMKVLRDLALNVGVPILLVSHVRKESGPRRDKPLIPGIDDLHGSSDISKIATAIVMISNARHMNITDANRPPGYPTFMRVAKSRRNGKLPWFTAVAFYDHRTGHYGKRYALGQLIEYDCGWEPLELSNETKWAKHSSVAVLAKRKPKKG